MKISMSKGRLLAVLALSGMVAKFAKDDDNLTGE